LSFVAGAIPTHSNILVGSLSLLLYPVFFFSGKVSKLIDDLITLSSFVLGRFQGAVVENSDKQSGE
jgi:hypothetical protein